VADSAPGHPEIRRIVAPNPGPMTLEGTNTFLVERGLRAYVVDPGPDDPGHVRAVRAAGEALGGIAGILLTHAHGDHAEGAGSLGGPVLWPPAESGEPAEEVEAGPFRVVPTPGHSPDHVVFLVGRACFCGDLVLGEGSSFVPPDGGSLAAYLDSLRRVRELDAELLCPGHGPWITDPKGNLDEYLEHRLDRERKLLAALERGERSRAGLLASAWDDVPPELRGAAAAVMEAHLEKLETEGRLPDDLRD
jgi:glyoxylase-like metal-dependent hydrolase (beta-lactamase superfamily II)